MMGRTVLLIILFILVLPALAEERTFHRYNGTGFSFEVPSGWNLTQDGDELAGNFTAEGPGILISMTWFQDADLDPYLCLGQIIKAYRNEGLRFSVLTADGGMITIDGQKASTLDIYYRYIRYEAKKQFVVWSSPRSGRFFYVSAWFSPGGEDEYALFDHLLETFTDEGDENFVVLEPRSSVSDSWAVLLQDLLSSSHYTGQRVSRPASVRVETAFSIYRMEGQANRLSSKETLTVIQEGETDPMVMAVAGFLRENGYQVRLLRIGGSIWIVVQDPAGLWQAVSIDLPEGQEKLGLLIPSGEQDWYKGWTFEQTEPSPIEGSEPIERDCDPSQLVQLRPQKTVNLNWTLGLRDLLDGCRYSQNDHDPVNRSQVCWAVLHRHDYGAKIMTGYEGHPLHPHMWVVVKHPGGDGYVAVETMAEGPSRLGRIAVAGEYYQGIMYNSSVHYTHLHPERGMWLEPG